MWLNFASGSSRFLTLGLAWALDSDSSGTEAGPGDSSQSRPPLGLYSNSPVQPSHTSQAVKAPRTSMFHKLRPTPLQHSSSVSIEQQYAFGPTPNEPA
ncbi:hypothetical protein OF83DRAFT_500184 [Amylostereum chailletii]|nr:hypothetical protein OF83DRAFT_500184 [Amylostereum chailletii]